MKIAAVSALAGSSAALFLCGQSMATPHLVVVSQNTTDAFLTANGLQSVVIGITGFDPGLNLGGFRGTAPSPWVIATSDASAFFNIDSVPPYFDGQQQSAATALVAPVPGAMFDSGVTGGTAANALGVIYSGGVTNPIGFAQFGVGLNSGPGTDVFWIPSNPNGIAIVGTAQLLRLTWSASQSATFSAAAVIHPETGAEFELSVSITIPPVPGPGGSAILVIAVFVRRRRRD